MSAPVKHGDKSEEALLYAPPWARERAREGRDPPLTDARLPTAGRLPPAGRLADTRIEWSPEPSKPPAFEGDVAVIELRHRLSVDPRRIPEPPLRMQRGPLAPSSLAKVPLYLGLAAIIAYGMVELSDFRGARPIPASLDKGIVATKELRPTVTPIEARPTAATRLVVENRQAFANEPLALGIGLLGAIGGESVFFNGLVRGTHFSAGDPFGSTGWQLKASELGKVYAYAPNSFVGAMNAQIELR